MYKSLNDLWTDRVYRRAYGDDVGYSSEKGVPMSRPGVGTIETGPSNPRATIPTGQVSPTSGPIQEIPAAFGPETVMPASLQAKKAEDYSSSEVKAAARAQSRLKSYLQKVNSGTLK